MNKANRLKSIALVMLCLPLCGGWTAAPEAEAAEQDNRYVGGELISTYATETISFISKEIVCNITTPNTTPVYYAVNGMQNACGPVAGAIAVGYYDKYYENLIPNWTAYYSSGRYRMQDTTYVPALIQDLYDSMQTNVVAPGVSESEFKSGLYSYVVNHGYNLTYTSLGNGNNFDINTFKTAVTNNQISILFVQPSDVYIFQSGDTEDRLTSHNISGNHIMVAFGYYEVKYTFSYGTRTDRYLEVATGLLSVDRAFYKIGSYIDAAYKVTIN